MPLRSARSIEFLRLLPVTPVGVFDLVLTCAICFLPNVLLGFGLFQSTAGRSPAYWLKQLGYFLNTADMESFGLWAIVNALLVGLLCVVRRHVLTPLAGIIQQMHGMNTLIAGSGNARIPALSTIRTLARDITCLTQWVHEYYVKQQEITLALAHARASLADIMSQHTAIVATTSREMVLHYQSVLAYANYLEERIARHAVTADLRYDFDEVSESSFNLKLIAGALNLSQLETASFVTHIDMPLLMQQAMLALAPSLDRRSMKLTTADVELGTVAVSEPAIIAHVLWMMLLGTIRYAADESTLRLRCVYNPGRTRVWVSIVVSELSPGRLTEEERSAFMDRQSAHLTPHLFAETLGIHANIQLAQMLLAKIDAALSVVPLTGYSCEIRLDLPAVSAR